MKQRNPLIAWVLGAFASIAVQADRYQSQHTHTRRSKGTRSKEGLPAGYPGSKLARKAARKQITLRNITYQS